MKFVFCTLIAFFLVNIALAAPPNNTLEAAISTEGLDVERPEITRKIESEDEVRIRVVHDRSSQDSSLKELYSYIGGTAGALTIFLTGLVALAFAVVGRYGVGLGFLVLAVCMFGVRSTVVTFFQYGQIVG